MTSANVLQLRRALTDTPLARQHERMLEGRASPVKRSIPWRQFDRSRYPEPALQLACEAQRALALGEYGAVELFARVAAALATNGVPLDLVAAATRVPSDELRHADYALRMAGLLAGGKVTLTVDRSRLQRPWRAPATLAELDLLMVDVPTISETLAAALLAACQRRASDPVAKALFTSIVADEVHHARVGWYYLAWRAPQWSRAERQRVADFAGSIVAGVASRFATGRDAPRGAQRAARALGVLDTAGQREAVARVMEDELVPGLDALGLGASHAWRARRPILA